MSLLSVKNLDKRFGGLHAVKDVSIEVETGEILGILGPNGAGKTTLYNLLTGFIRPDNGQVLLDGQPLLGMAPHKVVGLGVARTFQLCRPFVGLTVLENVMVGSYGPRVHSTDLRARAMQLLAQVGLAGKEDSPSELLSYGDQRRLEIARALATEPRLLLLDEPCSALDPISTGKIEELIDELKQDYTIVIVTHNMQQAARVSQRTAFFHLGKVVEYGETSQIFTNPREERTKDYITGRYG